MTGSIQLNKFQQLFFVSAICYVESAIRSVESVLIYYLQNEFS